MKDDKLDYEDCKDTKELTLQEFNNFVILGSEIIIKLTPLVQDAYRTLKNIGETLKNFKKER